MTDLVNFVVGALILALGAACGMALLRAVSVAGSRKSGGMDREPTGKAVEALAARVRALEESTAGLTAQHAADRAEWLDKIERAYHRLRARQQRQDEQAALQDPPELTGTLDVVRSLRARRGGA